MKLSSSIILLATAASTTAVRPTNLRRTLVQTPESKVKQHNRPSAAAVESMTLPQLAMEFLKVNPDDISAADMESARRKLDDHGLHHGDYFDYEHLKELLCYSLAHHWDTYVPECPQTAPSLSPTLVPSFSPTGKSGKSGTVPPVTGNKSGKSGSTSTRSPTTDSLPGKSGKSGSTSAGSPTADTLPSSKSNKAGVGKTGKGGAVTLPSSKSNKGSSGGKAAKGEDTQDLCSCSPTVFTFTLSLDQTCDNDTIEGNPGIVETICFTEDGGVTIPLPAITKDGGSESSSSSLPAFNWAKVMAAIAETADTTAAVDEDPVAEIVSIQFLEVTEIVSVQFLEFDTSGDLKVINQDDTYADVSLVDGDKLKFASASSSLDTSLPLSEQMSSPALVPGGASLILYGKTASGVVVRNRFFWLYDMNCGSENSPVNVDDTIGWVNVSEISNAWPTFCPALPEGSPTISP